MKRYRFISTLLIAIGAMLTFNDAAIAQAPTVSVGHLLAPCMEGDNDSRWGSVAEMECEQYITGFTDALVLTGAVGKDKGICLPDVNRADEVRWAFMRWANKNFAQRDEPAAQGLHMTLKEHFPCK